jgi:hypothetical protein
MVLNGLSGVWGQRQRRRPVQGGALPIVSRITSLLTEANEHAALQPEHLEGFRRSQQVVYADAMEVEGGLRVGMTENLGLCGHGRNRVRILPHSTRSLHHDIVR